MKYRSGEGNMIINDKVVTSIQIGFENMEYFTIPVECVEYLDLKKVKADECEIDCLIVDKGKIVNGWGSETSSFAQRVKQYNDITTIVFVCEDGGKYTQKVVWYYGEVEGMSYQYSENNEYQETNFYSYKEVEFSIHKANKTYKLGEVLSIGIYKDTIFEDEFEIKYLSSNGTLYVLGAIQPVHLTLEILNTKFTKVD